MSIRFACPQCKKEYKVADDLAGKSAKCGCGHRMKVPGGAAAASASSRPAAAVSPQKPPAGGAAKPAAKKVASAPAASVPRKPAAAPAAAAKQPKTASAASEQSDLASWLDGELEVEPLADLSASSTAAADATCPECGAALTGSAVICVVCGYDRRSGQRVAAEAPSAKKKGKKRSKSKRPGGLNVASLVRGTIFSALGALLGAAVWAVLVLVTQREFGIVAWGLGGLCGAGMAIGHEDDDGTIAGIIAACMSIFGIVAAKVMIVVFVIGYAVSQLAGALSELEAMDNSDLAPQRQAVLAAIADEKIEQLEDDASFSDIGQIYSDARTEVLGMSDDEVAQRFSTLSEEYTSLVEEIDFAASEDEIEPIASDVQLDSEPFSDLAVEEPGMVNLFFSTMFSPWDALWILFAFITAYKVGSGQATD